MGMVFWSFLDSLGSISLPARDYPKPVPERDHGDKRPVVDSWLTTAPNRPKPGQYVEGGNGPKRLRYSTPAIDSQ